VNYFCQKTINEPPRARQIASVHSRKRAGPARCPGQTYGLWKRSDGVFTKAELDACVVENRKYSPEDYKKLTRLQQQKLWMLRNPGKTPGQGPTCNEQPRGQPQQPRQCCDRGRKWTQQMGQTEGSPCNPGTTVEN
jgi:hypothetical protein